LRPFTTETEVAEKDVADPTELIGHVAHEMRTPLTALIQALDILDGGRCGPLLAVQERFVRIARQNADAALKLTVRLQEMARCRGGRVPIAFARYDAAAPASFVVQALEPIAATRGIDLEVVVDPDAPAGWGDEDLVREVLYNLVGNALKFTPPGGRVVLSVRPAEGFGMQALDYAVADTGPGLPAGTEDRVFDKFFQNPAARSRRGEGMGLGLAITRDIVHAHGGEVTAHNHAGRGCTFLVRLPALGSGLAAQAQLRRFVADGDGESVTLVALIDPDGRAGLLEDVATACEGSGLEILDLGRGRVGVARAGERESRPLVLASLLDILVKAGRTELVGGWSAQARPMGREQDLIEAALASLAAADARQEPALA
jgi:hypothetical protein